MIAPMQRIIITIVAATLSSAALADVVGRASVIDGDTIEIHGQRIRLHGIDAPEKGQPCFDASGKPYRCGQIAAMALDEFIGSSPVTCAERDTDRYGRTVATCAVRGVDIEAWLVLKRACVCVSSLFERPHRRRTGSEERKKRAMGRLGSAAVGLAKGTSRRLVAPIAA